MTLVTVTLSLTLCQWQCLHVNANGNVVYDYMHDSSWQQTANNCNFRRSTYEHNSQVTEHHIIHDNITYYRPPITTYYSNLRRYNSYIQVTTYKPKANSQYKSCKYNRSRQSILTSSSCRSLSRLRDLAIDASRYSRHARSRVHRLIEGVAAVGATGAAVASINGRFSTEND